MRRACFAIHGARWWLREGAQESGVATALEQAFAALASGSSQNLKSGRRKELYPLNLCGGAQADHLLKVNHYAGSARWRPSKARRELERAEAVQARGIATPLPLAAGERRQGGRLASCYLLVPLLQDVVDLRRLLLDPGRPALAPEERRALAVGFGRFTRRVLDAGIFQEDSAPNNFLVRRGSSPAFLMIDFERAALRRRLGERSRRFVLSKLERELARLSSAERMRFLIAFSSDDRNAARRRWQAIARAAPRLARRDLARGLRNATPRDRRLQELSVEGWSGFARRDAEEPRLRAALARVSVEAPGAGSPGDLWPLRYPQLAPREGRRLWSLANLLHRHRRLGPAPLALLWRDREGLLLLAREGGAQRLSELAERAGAEPALRLLLRRLLALGELHEAPGAEALALRETAPGRLRAELLAPELLALPGRGARDASTRARSLARQLVAPA